MMDLDLYTPETAGPLLGISARMVRRWCQQLGIGRKIGSTWLLSQADVDALRDRPRPGRPSPVEVRRMVEMILDQHLVGDEAGWSASEQLVRAAEIARAHPNEQGDREWSAWVKLVRGALSARCLRARRPR